MESKEGTIASLECRVAALEMAMSQFGTKFDSERVVSEGHAGSGVIMPFGGGNGGAFSFEEEQDESGSTIYKFKNCNFMVARQIYSIEDVTVTTDGMWYLVVDHSSPSSSRMGHGNLPDRSDHWTYVPIAFLVKDSEGAMEVDADYRGMPMIAIYE